MIEIKLPIEYIGGELPLFRDANGRLWHPANIAAIINAAGRNATATPAPDPLRQAMEAYIVALKDYEIAPRGTPGWKAVRERRDAARDAVVDAAARLFEKDPTP